MESVFFGSWMTKAMSLLSKRAKVPRYSGTIEAGQWPADTKGHALSHNTGCYQCTFRVHSSLGSGNLFHDLIWCPGRGNVDCNG